MQEWDFYGNLLHQKDLKFCNSDEAVQQPAIRTLLLFSHIHHSLLSEAKAQKTASEADF